MQGALFEVEISQHLILRFLEVVVEPGIWRYSATEKYFPLGFQQQSDFLFGFVWGHIVIVSDHKKTPMNLRLAFSFKS